MNRTLPMFLLVFAPIALATPASAQGGVSGVPDLSEFAGAISKSVATPTKVKASAGGVFKSGLAVPSVKPGDGARNVGRMFREAGVKAGGPKEALMQLEAAMPQVLTAIEAAFVKNGLAKRDMGVAMGYTFLDLYECGTKQSVPEKTSVLAVKVLAAAYAKHWGPKFSALTPAAKEKLYEQLIITTSLNTLLVEQFETAGKTEDAAGIRQASAEMFEKLVGVPPSQVTIAPDGSITGLAGDTGKTKKAEAVESGETESEQP